MDNESIVKMDNFLRIAATESLDAAASQFGEVINAREAAALSKLSANELKTLHEINSKLSAQTGFDASKFADWACGALC